MAPPNIHQNQTETLVSYPPLVLQPSAATVRIQTPSTALPASASAATIDTVDTTLAAAALAGAESVTLASGSGIVSGRMYAAADDGVPAFAVRVESVSGAVVYLSDPLPVALGIGATFKGYAVSASVSDTTLVGEGLAKFTATISGVVYQWDQRFKVVRDDIPQILTGAELVSRYPAVRELGFASDKTHDEAIAAATADVLLPDIRAKDLDPNRINSWELFKAPLAKATLWHLVNQNQSSDPDYVERLWADYVRSFRQATQSRGVWYDEANEDAGRGEAEKSNIRSLTYWR